MPDRGGSLHEGDVMYSLLLRGGLPLAAALTVMVAPTYAMTPAPPLPVQIQDQCNPPTFNAAVGPGTCVGNGAVTFQQFVNELTQLHFAPQWHFVPDQLQMTIGQSFIATNMGGEVHSFTEVDAFGGGVVPFLNDLSGRGATRPECAAAFNLFRGGASNTSFLFPGQSFMDTEGPNDVGHPVLYQCCIHPWMNETITVRS
jgi:hypothetical protein